MFNITMYIYSFLLGLLLGVILATTAGAFIRPVITKTVYEEAQECRKAGGEYRAFYWLSDTKLDQECTIKNDLIKY